MIIQRYGLPIPQTIPIPGGGTIGNPTPRPSPSPAPERGAEPVRIERSLAGCPSRLPV